jgi:hypothetical protein
VCDAVFCLFSWRRRTKKGKKTEEMREKNELTMNIKKAHIKANWNARTNVGRDDGNINSISFIVCLSAFATSMFTHAVTVFSRFFLIRKSKFFFKNNWLKI